MQSLACELLQFQVQFAVQLPREAIVMMDRKGHQTVSAPCNYENCLVHSLPSTTEKGRWEFVVRGMLLHRQTRASRRTLTFEAP
jgi:hypothetical protein